MTCGTTIGNIVILDSSLTKISHYLSLPSTDFDNGNDYATVILKSIYSEKLLVGTFQGNIYELNFANQDILMVYRMDKQNKIVSIEQVPTCDDGEADTILVIS